MPVLAITEIPLDTHDDFGKFRRLYCPDKTYLFCQSWVAVFTVINLAHAAADTDIEPHQLVALDDCNQSQVLAVDINIITRRDDKTHLELTRQVEFSINRLFACLLFRDRKSVG